MPVFGLFLEETALLAGEVGPVELRGYGGWLRCDFEWARVSPGAGCRPVSTLRIEERLRGFGGEHLGTLQTEGEILWMFESPKTGECRVTGYTLTGAASPRNP
jgi:hypothetical protein